MELQDLLNELTKVYLAEQRQKAEAREHGECFNLFNILGLRTNEVRVHSAFIAELLNPNGSHGMQDAFLKEFLRTIGAAENLVTGSRKPIVERYIGPITETTGGRIDIILEDGKHAVIIENKIKADDQENQLLRYHNYGKTKFPEGFLLIYLTLDGHVASEFSTGGAERLEYQCRSYATDIVKWLGLCMAIANDKPLVRASIQQYITLIKELTGQNMSTESSDKIVELALANIEATTALLLNQDEIRNAIMTRYIITPLREWAEENGLEFEAHDDKLDFKKPSWTHCIRIDSTVARSMGIPNTQNDRDELTLQVNEGGTIEGWTNAHDWWPYGWEYLPTEIRRWDSPSTFSLMKDGTVADWIKNRIQEIICEVEAKHLPI